MLRIYHYYYCDFIRLFCNRNYYIEYCQILLNAELCKLGGS
jgi:hypothetical protein